MQSHTEHVYSEPRKARHDVAENRHDHQAALTNEPAPARVQNDGAPEYDQDCAIFFWIPTPKPSPGLVSPNSPEDSSNETEQGSKANDPISHSRKGIGRFLI